MDRAPVTVSIIIPSYCHAAYVAETIGSAMQQDFPAEQFELIIIDDGSSDDSALLMRQPLRGEG